MNNLQPTQNNNSISPTESVTVVEKRKLTVEDIQRAKKRFDKYKEGKANLENQIIENERWYRKRHWELMEGDKNEQVKPESAWLFNCIANKHADAMDNFPAPNILPREDGDREQAQVLSSIIPVILEQDNFKKTYSRIKDDNIQNGTGIYGIFWDKSKHNGKGDIAIKCIDILNVFWEPGVTDIQDSKDFFHIELRDNELLENEYPQLRGKLGGNTGEVKEYMSDDKVDTTEKTVVYDWYYKKYQNNKLVLHYCKFVNDVILYATENETKPITAIDKETGEEIFIKEAPAVTGWYEHGKYPFVFDVLYARKNTPAGFGYIDIGKNAQEYIDRGGQAIMQNMIANARPRHFVSKSTGIKAEDYADLTKDFVEVEGNPENSIMPINGKALNGIYVTVMNNKIEELKETTGNRDVSTGGTTSGATAASAIAALQEASSKLSRDNNCNSYIAFKEVILQVVELIRQFYDVPRCFRILGEQGDYEFVKYSNDLIKPQHQGIEFGIDYGYRMPLFDVEISAEKQSPYSKLAQNELAIQFYTAGFFNPQLADQALACLDMMDFDRKEFIMQKISANGTMYQQLMMMQQQMLMMAQRLDQIDGTNLTQQIMMSMGGQAPVAPAGAIENASDKEALGGEAKESKVTKDARTRVADSTAPN